MSNADDDVVVKLVEATRFPQMNHEHGLPRNSESQFRRSEAWQEIMEKQLEEQSVAAVVAASVE